MTCRSGRVESVRLPAFWRRVLRPAQDPRRAAIEAPPLLGTSPIGEGIDADRWTRDVRVDAMQASVIDPASGWSPVRGRSTNHRGQVSAGARAAPWTWALNPCHGGAMMPP
jgi:hypothetical protein